MIAPNGLPPGRESLSLLEASLPLERGQAARDFFSTDVWQRPFSEVFFLSRSSNPIVSLAKMSFPYLTRPDHYNFYHEFFGPSLRMDTPEKRTAGLLLSLPSFLLVLSRRNSVRFLPVHSKTKLVHFFRFQDHSQGGVLFIRDLSFI